MAKPKFNEISSLPPKRRRKPVQKRTTKASSSPSAASHRRHLFVEAYLVNGNNATQAAITAGLSEKTAYSTGQRMLYHAEVKGLIEERQKKMLSDLQISSERTLRERARGAYYDIGELAKAKINKPADIAALPDDVRQAITGWKWDKDGNLVLQFADKHSHLTALERHLGLYKADNEQAAPETAVTDHIEAARAIAFVLARAKRQMGKNT